jgi:dipeptidyl aminopeptidase/acylaminoacyl peptidase
MADFEALRAFRDGDLDILSRDYADRVWTVAYTAADAPVLFALYDRGARRVTPLFSERPTLEDARLSSARPISFNARDGLPLEGYLTLPSGMEPKGLPAVVLVHGGPWARTLWGFDPEVQWLANRGYAVIQVNYRGSTGYGKDHLNAGDREWGGKMLLDLLDARKWAVDQGYADPRRIAIMGAGFGGYAALAALAFHPDEFAAGVSLGGPPNLITMISAVPTNAPAVRAVLDRRVGRVETDAARLRAQSPASRASLIKAPLLVAATAGDPQVPVSDVDALVAAIRKEGRSPEYLYFADEGAIVRTFVNRLRFHAAVEAFLGRHLGGRVEPPADFEQFEKLRR